MTIYGRCNRMGQNVYSSPISTIMFAYVNTLMYISKYVSEQNHVLQHQVLAVCVFVFVELLGLAQMYSAFGDGPMCTKKCFGHQTDAKLMYARCRAVHVALT